MHSNSLHACMHAHAWQALTERDGNSLHKEAFSVTAWRCRCRHSLAFAVLVDAGGILEQLPHAGVLKPQPGVVGVCEVTREAYPDPTATDEAHKGFGARHTAADGELRWSAVDVRLVRCRGLGLGSRVRVRLQCKQSGFTGVVPSALPCLAGRGGQRGCAPSEPPRSAASHVYALCEGPLLLVRRANRRPTAGLHSSVLDGHSLLRMCAPNRVAECERVYREETTCSLIPNPCWRTCAS